MNNQNTKTLWGWHQPNAEGLVRNLFDLTKEEYMRLPDPDKWYIVGYISYHQGALEFPFTPEERKLLPGLWWDAAELGWEDAKGTAEVEVLLDEHSSNGIEKV